MGVNIQIDELFHRVRVVGLGRVGGAALLAVSDVCVCVSCLEWGVVGGVGSFHSMPMHEVAKTTTFLRDGGGSGTR